jgi:tetratricopeptide (TPR) repeat protein
VTNGEINAAFELVEKAIALKEAELGKQHPDVAISLDGAGWTLVQLGRPKEALERIDRAIAIYEKRGDPSCQPLAGALLNRGDALLALGRTGEARESYERADEVLKSDAGTSMPNAADVLSGIGRVELAEGRPALAAPMLEKALAIYVRYAGYASTIAEIQFALARALGLTRGDQKRARELAIAARETYARQHDLRRRQAVETWLAGNHRPQTM